MARGILPSVVSLEVVGILDELNHIFVSSGGAGLSCIVDYMVDVLYQKKVEFCVVFELEVMTY